jgi:hypothetical protein
MCDHTHIEARVIQIMKRFEKAKIGIAYQSENGAENILHLTTGEDNKSRLKTVQSTN